MRSAAVASSSRDCEPPHWLFPTFAFFVERRPDDFGGAAFAVVQNTPDRPRIGVLGRPYLSEPARYSLRSSRRRHWEKLPHHPRGLCALGDAIASFNPIYGQGMTSALLQVQTLGAALDRHGNGPHLAPAVARGAARVVDGPWLTATGADFVYDQTEGRRSHGTRLVNRYVERLTRASAVDESVDAAFTGVQQLLATPPSLFRPTVVARVLRHGGPAHRPQPRPVRQAVAS